MVIRTLALLASSFAVATTPPFRLVETKKAFAVPMFQPPAKTTPSARRATSRPAIQEADPSPSFVCHITVVKPDPEIDRNIARQTPKGFDSKIVRRSVCADPPTN